MAFLVVDVCEWSVCWIGGWQTVRCWRELRKEEPNRDRLKLTKPSIFETGAPASQPHCCLVECSCEPLKEESGLLSARCGTNRLWTLHLACWVISKGRSELKASDWRKGAASLTSPVMRFRVQSLSFLLSSPPQTRARSMAPRRYRVSTC